MSSPRRSLVAAAVALVAVAGLTGCAGGHRSAAPATVPPGTVTVDRWIPPALTGGPSVANFCAALTAIYQHTGELTHVVSKKVSEDILSDYVSYAPTVIAVSPPAVRSSASVYMDAVSTYLTELVRAGLDLSRLPAGALAGLGSSTVDAAYSSLYGYSQTECHYAIGASTSPS